MPNPKEKRSTERVAGRKKFELPPREVRVIIDNPVRELLQSITQEAPAVQPHPMLAEEPKALLVAVPALKEAVSPKRKSVPKVKAATEARNLIVVSGERGKEYDFFQKKYGKLIGKARLRVCEVLYDLSNGQGRKECFSSIGKLATLTGFTERYIFKLVGQLESLGFVEKVETINTATVKGTTFRLHLEPVIK